MIAYSYIKVLSMSFDLSVPKITFIFYPTEEQVWEFWDVFLILLFFFWKEDEEQDLDWEARPLGELDLWNELEPDNMTPFRRACEKGDSEKVATLLKSGEHGNENVPLFRPDEKYDGQSSISWLDRTMIWACKHGDVEVVNILLNKGATLNSCVGHYPPLHYACMHGHADVAKVLLEKGADITFDTNCYKNLNQKNTPLLIASKNGHADVVNVLLDNGADVNENLKQSFYYDPVHDFSRYNTPLYISWMSAHSDVIKLLLDRQANTDVLW